MALLRYELKVNYRPGKDMVIPDALSRAVIDGPVPEINDVAEIDSIISSLPITDERLSEVRGKTAADPVLQELRHMVNVGWPESRAKVPTSLRPYYQFRDDISCCNGLMMRENQIIIPQKMRA